MKYKHIHKYQKFEWGRKRTIIWRCILPNCPHYLHPEFIVGKQSICHRCDEVFLLSKDKLARAKPLCDICSGRGTKEKHMDLDFESLDKLIKDL